MRKPRAAIRRFDVFAEYNRQKALADGIAPDEAAGYGLWVAKVVASRGFGRSMLSHAPSKVRELASREGDGSAAPEPSKWHTLGGQPQTDELFQREIVERMGPAFYDEVFSPAIAAAVREDRPYPAIRDAIRRDWIPGPEPEETHDSGGALMSMQDLNALFEHELKDIFFAEHKLVEALQELAGESTQPEIRKAFEEHRKETENHIRRLERVFSALGEPPAAEPCPGIEGLLKEKKAFAKEKPSPAILEYYNLGAAAKTERYEITAYESLIAMGRKLKLTDAVELLRENLDEEEAALSKVKALARGYNLSEVLPASAAK